MKKYILCIDNKDYEASLEIRKIYQILNDTEAEKHQQIRVIDDSDEDHLYPIDYFAPIQIPSVTQKKLERITP